MICPLDKEYSRLLINRSNLSTYPSNDFFSLTKNAIQRLFDNLILVEVKMEIWRKRLNNETGFSARRVFDYIDRLSRNYLLETDVSVFI